MDPVTKRKDEQVKQIELITGGKVDFWSLEEPDSGRGRKYKVAVVEDTIPCFFKLVYINSVKIFADFTIRQYVVITLRVRTHKRQ